jgi:ABC-type polysaccharide/polyol phosphate export permease
VDRLPTFIKWIIYLLPLTHTNIIMRKGSLDEEGLFSLGILAVYAIAFSIYGSRLIRKYSE